MTTTAFLHRMNSLRWRDFLWIVLLGMAGTSCLAQELTFDSLGIAEAHETPLGFPSEHSYYDKPVMPAHGAIRQMPTQRITSIPPALPSQKLSAVLEPPPLPALDALLLASVDEDLDIVHVHPPTPLPDSLPEPIPAVASYYNASLAGNLTASGERYNPAALTAAHRTLPFGTRLRITNVRNGKSVVVRVNDRGPFVKGRGIDLSRAAAELIGMVRRGIARVTVEEIEKVDAPF